MLFEKNAKLYSYEVRRESGENVAYVNYLGAPFIPSIAKSPEIMSRVIDLLIESPNISRLVLVQQRNYNYNSNQINILAGIASLYTFLLKQEKILSVDKISSDQRLVSQRYTFLNYFIQILKMDPILAYKKISNSLIEEKAASHSGQPDNTYRRLLEKIISLLEKTDLIQEVLSDINSIPSDDRSIYDQFFSPDIVPNYAFSRLV